MLLYNRPEYLTFMWACLSIGVAPVAINYRYRAGEVRALLLDSASKVLLVPTSLGEIAHEAPAGLEPPVDLITVDDGGEPVPGAVRYDDIIAEGGTMPAAAPRGADLRLYTGGTTGMPKAVVWDLDSLLVARQQSTWGVIGITPPEDLEGAIRIAVDPATPRVVTLPLYPRMHGTAQSTTIGTLAIGGTVVLHVAPRMDIDDKRDLFPKVTRDIAHAPDTDALYATGALIAASGRWRASVSTAAGDGSRQGPRRSWAQRPFGCR